MNRISIDTKIIGDIEFSAYIFKDENELLAFAITFQDQEEPLLLFHQIMEQKKINVVINTSIFYQIQNFKSYNKALRQKHFKAFETFVIQTEQKARKIAFGSAPLEYTIDNDLQECIRQAYIFN